MIIEVELSFPKGKFPIKPRTLIRAQERQKKLRRKLDARTFQRMGIAEGPANPTKGFRRNPV